MMMSSLAIICSLAILSVTSAFPTLLTKRAPNSCPIDAMSCSPNSGDSCCSPAHGLVVLTQQWIPGLGPADAFTLHGLWPDDCNGQYVEHCDPSRDYSSVEAILKNDPTLYQEALDYWPSNATQWEHPNDHFWTYEWQKHGTCVTTLSPNCYGNNIQPHQDVFEYFGTALRLRRENDLFSKLSNAGINPGGNYTVADFESVIGVKPMITCPGSKLSEVRIFFHVRNGNEYVPVDMPPQEEHHSCRREFYFPYK